MVLSKHDTLILPTQHSFTCVFINSSLHTPLSISWGPEIGCTDSTSSHACDPEKGNSVSLFTVPFTLLLLCLTMPYYPSLSCVSRSPHSLQAVYINKLHSHSHHFSAKLGTNSLTLKMEAAFPLKRLCMITQFYIPEDSELNTSMPR